MSQSKSHYKLRKEYRRAGLPMQARPNPPWWITRWACEGYGVNPYVAGPYYDLRSRARDTQGDE